MRPARRPAPSAAIPKCSTAPVPRSSSKARSCRRGCSPAPPTGCSRAAAWSMRSAASSREEGEERIDAFLAERPDFGSNPRRDLLDVVTPACARLGPRPARHAGGAKAGSTASSPRTLSGAANYASNRPHGPPAHLPVDPVRRFRQAGRGSPRDRRGRRRLDPYRRDGRAFRAQPHHRPGGGEGAPPAHAPSRSTSI